MTVNWKPGKTEAIVVYRGKGQKVQKECVAQDDETKALDIPIEPECVKYRNNCNDNTHLCVVNLYKHLGSIIECTGSLIPEARSRAKSALTAFVPLARNIFANKK